MNILLIVRSEIIVNAESFPIWLNNIFYVIFLGFALKYFEYVISLIVPENRLKIQLKL